MRDSGMYRRTFLMACGRFMATLPLSSLVRPPVLYSFPSDIRIATPAEQTWVYGNLEANLHTGAQRIGTAAAYNISFHLIGSVKGVE